MKTLRYLAVAAFAAGMMAAPASATTFIFKSGDAFRDDPTNAANIVKDCGTIGTDFCTDNDAEGFDYSKNGIEFTAVAYANGNPTTLIQDIFPDNSGLGAISEDDQTQDQIQFSSAESVEFTFTDSVFLSNIEFNAGNDTDCSNPGSEGPCGDFNLYIDNVFFATITAVDLLADTFFGSVFRFEPITDGAGFTIAQFDVSDVPVPAALPLLISGLAGLGFASRRKKSA